ncbi:FAD:protein FMN transferase [Pontivivens ytuae]|uniref:FAD:protein FMN transferase n=1 Tax=Pontivivens ytuae TaxID=2789856 RepID=A0A7S9QCH5_9RHOB|nr:FAD:protein FMN transferase [Pontivivens ytuae]QPH54228.1 FAD:protein FMN transferase [Pontivivens ytuae]
MKRRRFLAISACALAAPAAQAGARWDGMALGAEASIRLDGPAPDAKLVLAECRAELARAEALFSLYRLSALTQLNATGELFAPPREMVELLHECDALWRATDGLFDPTVQALWTGGGRGLVGWDRVEVSAARIRLGPGQALTLNGIAQGWATDRIVACLRRAGYGQALVHIGEHSALGGPYRLGLADPVHGTLGHLTLENAALATSSPMVDEMQHILAPTPGSPRWSTVSVEADRAVLADGLSTALTLAEDPFAMAGRQAGVRRVAVVDATGALRTQRFD